ncbi:hypothetical protein GCM10009416_21820 [Craurococcus roseus]|uniref:Restriction endonuclease domain-containing protein n=1 Tax=Craurococcus roseus TaxID=77585 RepID=A0ABP3Q931_9PROT
MTADEFMAWAIESLDGGVRCELVGGEIVGMAPERLAHARAKAQAHRSLADAIKREGLPCEAVPDGVAGQVSADTVYEPDALASSTRAHDAGAKLADYFRMPSVRHYLLADTKTRTVIHHGRADDGSIATRIARDGAVRLDPPGIALDVAELFLDAEG